MAVMGDRQAHRTAKTPSTVTFNESHISLRLVITVGRRGEDERPKIKVLFLVQ